MEEEKAKLIPFKPKKKTLVSKSGKGVVVKKPEDMNPDSSEDTSPDKEGPDAYVKKAVTLLNTGSLVEESKPGGIDNDYRLNLEQIEKDLVEVKNNKTFVQKLLGIDPMDEEIEHLEQVSRKLKLQIEVRNAISTLIRQPHELEKNLLEAQTSLLQKKALSQFEAQKITNEIELEKLEIEKSKKVLEKLEILQEIKEALRNLQSGKGPQDQKNEYSLKDLNTLEEHPGGESDDK